MSAHLADYLIRHDGRVARHGGELLRLAQAARVTAETLYLIGLNHRAPSARLARRLHEHSINRTIDAAALLGLRPTAPPSSTTPGGPDHVHVCPSAALTSADPSPDP